MKRPVTLLLCAAALILTTAAAGAADNGLYVGASVGQATLNIDDIDLEDEVFDFDADETAYKIFVGYRLLTFLAVEGSYVDFGTFEDSRDGASFKADASGFDVFAMGMLPLAIADVFVKIGAISWDADLRASIGDFTDSDSDSGTDPAYGLGVQFRIRSFAVRAEAELFDVDGADDLYMVSVGGSYTF